MNQIETSLPRRSPRSASALRFLSRSVATATSALILCLPVTVHANVYATNIRVRGSVKSTDTAATVFVPCDTAQISYLLNEPATAGVTVDILSNNAVVRTFTFSGGNPGTLQGVNSLIWDVKDSLGNVVPYGFYSVRVTAASDGYGDWTQISQDSAGNYSFQPSSIAVNRNPGSPFYGRVFVGNAVPGPNDGLDPGDTVGIQKLNADGSPVADGESVTGGWAWAGNSTSPWKIEVADDDYVYVNDWNNHGLVLRFDQHLAGGSRIVVLRGDNRPNGGLASLSGPFITGTGAGTQLWMADTNIADGVGIRRWTVSANGALAINDLGATIVAAGTNSDLNLAPYDLAVDRSNRIYIIQFRDGNADPAARVMRFPAFGASALTNADWQIGAADNNMRGASGIAVDSLANYVAVAFSGADTGLARSGGGVKVFNAANGADVYTLPVPSYHEHTDVAWDNVGNLYVCDTWDSYWRAYSPPGANQAATTGAQVLEVGVPPVGPVLSALSYSGGQFFFALGGRTNVDYVIEASTNLQTWFPVQTNNDPCATRVIPVNGPPSKRFFRAYTVTP